MELSNSQYKKLLKQKRDKERNEKFDLIMRKSYRKGFIIESRSENHIRLRRCLP